LESPETARHAPMHHYLNCASSACCRHQFFAGITMRTTLFCAIVTVLVAQAAMSPVAAGQAWAYGIRGAVTVSRLSGVHSSDPLTGYSAGLVVGGPVYSILGAQAELLLTRKSSSAIPDVVLTGPLPLSTVSFTYLQLPLLGRLSLGSKSDARLRPSAYVGPVLSLLLSCRHSMDSEDPISGASPGTVVSCETRSPPWSSLAVPFGHPRSTDLGLVGGIGVELALGFRASMAIDLRYERGLKSVDLTGIPDARTETFTVGVQLTRTM